MGVTSVIVDDISDFPRFPPRLLAPSPRGRPPARPRLEAAHHHRGGEPQEGGGPHPLFLLPDTQVAIAISSLLQKHKYTNLSMDY